MELPKRFCHHCGGQAQPAAKFCHRCGTSLASIDEKPPVVETQPEPAPNRMQHLTTRKKPTVTFAPIALRPNGDIEDDDEAIAADRVESIQQLGISLDGLDVNVDVGRPRTETVGSIVQQGAQLPAGYQEPSRPPMPANAQPLVAQILAEGGAIRPQAGAVIRPGRD